MSVSDGAAAKQKEGAVVDTCKEERFVSACCECGKIRQGNDWRKPDEVSLESVRLTHGYCPACFRAAMRVAVTFAATLGTVGQTN